MKLIDACIRKSCRLSQEAVIEVDDKKKADLEQKADLYWKKARALGDPGVGQANYENLANAIVEQAVRDYIDLLSSRDISTRRSNENNEIEIRNFANTQTYTKLNIVSMLDSIDQCYSDEFVPYVRTHAVEIVNDYRAAKKKKWTIADYTEHTKHRCPFCKNGLYPKHIFADRKKKNLIGYKIVCQNCGMNYIYGIKGVQKTA